MKIDLHVHTRFSPCSAIGPSELVERAKKAGLDAVAITDHNTVGGCREVKKVAGGLEVIPGIEVKTMAGDLIGLFVEEDIPKGLGVAETADRIRQLGGVVVVPHAFDSMRNSIGGRIAEASPDAIEVYNGRVIFGSFNERAEEYAIANGIAGIAGSDAHFVEEVGLAGVFTETDDVERCIRKGRLKLYHQAIPVGLRLGLLGARFSRKLRKMPSRLAGAYRKDK